MGTGTNREPLPPRTHNTKREEELRKQGEMARDEWLKQQEEEQKERKRKSEKWNKKVDKRDIIQNIYMQSISLAALSYAAQHEIDVGMRRDFARIARKIIIDMEPRI